MPEVRIKSCVTHSCCDKKKFFVKDTTGLYDAILNLYGWGADQSGDNIEITSTESSGLTITSPSGTVYGPYDILATLPSLDGSVLEIDLDDILDSGDVASYEDGYWSFDWTVQGVYGNNDTPFHARCLNEELFLCDVQCCVDNIVADHNPCGCSRKSISRVEVAVLTLASIKANDAVKNRESAKARLVNLQAICNNNCKNC